MKVMVIKIKTCHLMTCLPDRKKKNLNKIETDLRNIIINL